MKDDKGLYYYPFPENKRVHMYVKKENKTIYFRLWNKEDEKLWEDHGWVPYDAIKQAKAIYKNNNFDPNQAYDINIATSVLKEGEKEI